ncbi:MAG: c-type cytochrome, partial [Planctomycetes bacterium]|nr:c-type cytochrome [Planctomycetota bacterium]
NVAAALLDSDSGVQTLTIELASKAMLDPVALADGAKSPEVRAAAIRRLDGVADRDAVLRWLGDDDPWIRQAARTALSRSLSVDQLLQIGLPQDATRRLEIALLLRASGDPRTTALVSQLLKDDDRRIRLLAVQWVGEGRLTQFRDQVLARLKAGDHTGGILETILATLDLLERGGKPSAFERKEDQAVARLMTIAELPPPALARVLRYLPPDDSSLSAKRLTALLADPAIEVRTEAIRTLRESNRAQRVEMLGRLAADEQISASVRAEAIVGLSAADATSRLLLLSLTESPQAEVRDEALRSLRGVVLSSEEKQSLEKLAQRQPASRDLVARLVEEGWKPTGRPDPQKPAQWIERFSGGNAEAGERVFFHPQSPRCSTCHRVSGRGGRIGPELSVAGQMGTQRILESILTPSREIAPQFVNWSIALRDGRILTGLLLTEQGDGRRVYADATGTLHPIHRDQIEEVDPLSVSVMPDGLADMMTDAELRDLVAYLLKCR